MGLSLRERQGPGSSALGSRRVTHSATYCDVPDQPCPGCKRCAELADTTRDLWASVDSWDWPLVCPERPFLPVEPTDENFNPSRLGLTSRRYARACRPWISLRDSCFGFPRGDGQRRDASESWCWPADRAPWRDPSALTTPPRPAPEPSWRTLRSAEPDCRLSLATPPEQGYPTVQEVRGSKDRLRVTHLVPVERHSPVTDEPPGSVPRLG